MITAISEEERRIAKYQAGFVDRLRKSPYYIVESLKTTELPRYSDKYRPQAFSQPTLKKKDLNPDFFPPDLYDSYFNPRKKKKAASQAKRRKLNLDEFQEDQEEEKDSEEGSDKDSQVEEDYDVDEEDDNDYAENYFDNGEEDNMEDMVGGDEGVGDYDWTGWFLDCAKMEYLAEHVNTL